MTPQISSQTTPIELVRSMYDAFGRGDIAHILAHVAPDCQWIESGEGIPSAGKYTGPAGAAEFFRKLDESETITRFEPRQFLAHGDDVVALGFEEMQSKNTGKTASTNWAMLFRLREGKVVHFETFYDTAALARAHS
jgi:ketosteroid isomerase-like protein